MLPDRRCGPRPTSKATSDADGQAELISGTMLPQYWYANIHTSTHEIVIFAGRVFKHARGDADGRAAAEDYARSLGVPEHQLDWEQ